MKTYKVRAFVSLTAKVNALLIVALAIGIGAVFAVFSFSLISTRNDLTRSALLQQATMLYSSIENIMLPGEAPIAVNFFRDIELASPESRVMLFRRDGKKAFSDNSTIKRVNGILGSDYFKPRGREDSNLEAPPPRLLESVPSPPKDLFFREDSDGRAFFRVHRPLINLPKCTRCHGGDHTVRGVIDIRNDVTSSVRSQSYTLIGAGGGFLLVLAALSLLIGTFLGRVVLVPIGKIGKLCAEVAQGDFSGRVSVVNRDEIGELARTVNGMVDGLHERYELTKYVSAGTIGALRAGQEPTRVFRTLLFTDVRGFTAYTEKKDPERVVEILNALLEAEARIIHEEGGDIDKFVGDETVAIFRDEDAARRACKAALAIARLVAERSADFDGLNLGSGIASGSVIQGMIGSNRRADFTVIGDSVNLASRLCSIAKGGQIVVSDGTHKAVLSDFTFGGPFAARLKGKKDAQKVWILEGIAEAAKEGEA